MNFRQVVFQVMQYINLLLPLLGGVALLVFFFGLVKFISRAGSEDSHSEGRALMIWGVIGLFVMVSFMGIIAYFARDLGLGLPTLGLPTLPQSP